MSHRFALLFLLASFLCLPLGGCTPSSDPSHIADLRLAVGDEFDYLLPGYPLESSTYEVEPSNVASFEGSRLAIEETGAFLITVTGPEETFVQEGTAVEKTISAFQPSGRLKIGSSLDLSLRTGTSPNYVEQLSGFSVASLSGKTVTGLAAGKAAFHYRTEGGEVSQAIEIDVYDPEKPTSILLKSDIEATPVGTTFELTAIVSPSSMQDDVEIVIEEGADKVRMEGLTGFALKEGKVSLHASCRGVNSDSLSIDILDVSHLVPESFRIYVDDFNPVVGQSVCFSTGIYPYGFEAAVDYFCAPVSGEWSYSDEDASLVALSPGVCEVQASCGNVFSNSLYVYARPATASPLEGNLSLEKRNYGSLDLQLPFSYDGTEEVELVVLDGDDEALSDESLSPRLKQTGSILTVAALGEEGCLSNQVSFSTFSKDPYAEVSVEAFMAAFSMAASNVDAAYRSAHALPSGEDAGFDAVPERPSYVPMGDDDEYLRNSAADYVDSGSGYQLYDEYGQPAEVLYEAGGYLSLENVAAYVYGFGDVPANYQTDRGYSPTASPWGVYLRVNNNFFSGDTDNYPYEPELPRIYGCGGDLRYYEIDIGGGGYNNGTTINRGSLRIVYTRYYKNGGHIDDLEDRYVFYTYNHYNDFQEYLNYRGGWGERFGKVTAGGIANSDQGPAPSPYVEVTRVDFTTLL